MTEHEMVVYLTDRLIKIRDHVEAALVSDGDVFVEESYLLEIADEAIKKARGFYVQSAETRKG